MHSEKIFSGEDMGKLCPCTIIPARYSGLYERKPWVALPVEYSDIPPEVYGDDLVCQGWFAEPTIAPIGYGDNPNEACLDLLRQFRERKHESKE